MICRCERGFMPRLGKRTSGFRAEQIGLPFWTCFIENQRAVAP